MTKRNRTAVVLVVAILAVLALLVGLKAGNSASADVSTALKEAKPRMLFFYAPW